MVEQPDTPANPYSAGNTDSPSQLNVSSAGAKPRVWTVFATLLAGLLASGSTSVIVLAIMAATLISSGADPQELAAELPTKMMNPPVFIGMLVLSQLALGLVVFIAAKLSPVSFCERLGMRKARVGLSAYPLIMVGTLLPLALGVSAAHLIAKVIPADESAEALYEQMTAAWSIPFIILIGVFPGLMEEFLFRGYAQQRLLKRWGPAMGIVVTSIIFGLFHVTPHAVAMATILGLWLGWVSWRTNSVWPTVCCHAFVNSTWNIWQVGQRLWGMPENPSLMVKFAVGLIIVTCFLISIRLVVRAGADA